MMRSIALTAMALSLLGCTHAIRQSDMASVPGPWSSIPCPPAGASDESPCGDPIITDREQAACDALRGSIEKVGFFSSACVYPAPDAGRTCTDSSQCKGACVIPSEADTGESVIGHCAALVNAGGCANYVENGRATGLLCVD
jgi:hypothetical protein